MFINIILECFFQKVKFYSFTSLSWQRLSSDNVYNIQLSGCRLARSAPPSQISAPLLLPTVLLSTSYRDQSDPLPPTPTPSSTPNSSNISCDVSQIVHQTTRTDVQTFTFILQADILMRQFYNEACKTNTIFLTNLKIVTYSRLGVFFFFIFWLFKHQIERV